MTSGLEERRERLRRRFEIPVIIAALLVIPVVVLDGSNVGEPWKSFGTALNWGTWLVFAAEAFTLAVIARGGWRWIREHPLDIAVVCLTPPFLAAFAPVRLLRLLRLFRLLRLASTARKLFSPRGLEYAASLAALTVVAGGATYSSVEKNYSTADGIYWALTTMTTVGSNDVYPHTSGGKALAVLVTLVGIGFVAILTGAIAQRFFAGEASKEIAQVEEDIDQALLRELRDLRTRLVALEARIERREG